MLKPMKDNGTIRFYDEVNFVYYELGINNEPINIGDTKKAPRPTPMRGRGRFYTTNPDLSHLCG